jgi:transposase-like protein
MLLCHDWSSFSSFLTILTDQLSFCNTAGTSWYVDETYLKVNDKWCYLYRAIDRDGHLVDSRLSEKRDMDAAKRFFEQAIAVVGHTPESVTTDGHRSYPRAISEIMGNKVHHRMNKYLNNRLEQDHRGIKQRYYPMRGFGTFVSASRFCGAFDELRNYFRLCRTMGKPLSLLEQRRTFLQRLATLQALVQTAS